MPPSSLPLPSNPGDFITSVDVRKFRMYALNVTCPSIPKVFPKNIPVSALYHYIEVLCIVGLNYLLLVSYKKQKTYLRGLCIFSIFNSDFTYETLLAEFLHSEIRTNGILGLLGIWFYMYSREYVWRQAKNTYLKLLRTFKRDFSFTFIYPLQGYYFDIVSDICKFKDLNSKLMRLNLIDQRSYFSALKLTKTWLICLHNE